MNKLHLNMQTNRHMLEITSMKNKVDIKLSVMNNCVDYRLTDTGFLRLKPISIIGSLTI